MASSVVSDGFAAVKTASEGQVTIAPLIFADGKER